MPDNPTYPTSSGHESEADASADAERAPRVLIIEDHELLTQLLVLAFHEGGIEDVIVANQHELHVEAVMDLAERVRPDIVLLDLHLGRAGPGLGHVRHLVELGAAVLIMTASDDPGLLGECLDAGAAGIFSKADPFETLVQVVRDAARGDAVIGVGVRERLLGEVRQRRQAEQSAHQPFTGLTDRERVVLVALVRGETAEQIAVDEYVTVATVRSQIKSVLRKLGVNSQLHAVAMARNADWPKPDTG